ncbi:hypothetical protein [Streptomyces triticagri]|uniref:hypothetical protein n=1 Tax=Streptomyces triticagri TaxID=2293568 RepID=UPI001313FDFE|nr:hypothetical protein [Streptomyces triticagri]
MKFKFKFKFEFRIQGGPQRMAGQGLLRAAHTAHTRIHRVHRMQAKPDCTCC